MNKIIACIIFWFFGGLIGMLIPPENQIMLYIALICIPIYFIFICLNLWMIPKIYKDTRIKNLYWKARFFGELAYARRIMLYVMIVVMIACGLAFIPSLVFFNFNYALVFLFVYATIIMSISGFGLIKLSFGLTKEIENEREKYDNKV